MPTAGAPASILALATAAVTYGVAATAGGSGFMAVYVAGVVLRSLAAGNRVAIGRFTTALGAGAETGLFLLLGLLVFPSRLPAAALTGLAIAAVLLLVARPLAVWLCLLPFHTTPREDAAIGWLGLRGAVPIVLATFALSAGVDGALVVFDVVFVVVVASLAAQSFTARSLISRLGLSPDVHEPIEIDLLPLDGIDPQTFTMLTVVLPEDAAVVSREIRDVAPPLPLRIVVVQREGRTISPRGTTRLLRGDRLVVSTDRPGDADAVIRSWLAQPAPDDAVG